MSMFNRYFVVALDTDDEHEAIKTAWKLRAKFVFDYEKGKLATILTNEEGSRLYTTDQGKSEFTGRDPLRSIS